MNTVHFIFFIQLFLFVTLVSTCFYVTFHKKVDSVPKYIIAVCALAILALSDKFKLIAALGMVAIIYFIKYFHRKKHEHGIKRSWKLDS